MDNEGDANDPIHHVETDLPFENDHLDKFSNDATVHLAVQFDATSTTLVTGFFSRCNFETGVI